MSLKKLNPNKAYKNSELVDQINRLNIAVDRFIEVISSRLSEQDEEIENLKKKFDKVDKKESLASDYLIVELSRQRINGKEVDPIIHRFLNVANSFNEAEGIVEDITKEDSAYNNLVGIYKLVEKYE